MAHHITLHAPAKTNLFLGVGALDGHGYHNVDTVLCPLGLHDVITLAPAVPRESSTLACTGETSVEVAAEENLAMRALRAMQKAFGRAEEFAITLEKHIPSGAGLGGGSSDAAAVIAGVAHMWDIDSRDKKLAEVARTLGADVPFFLYGGATYMDGRGDHFVCSYDMPRLEVALVKPVDPVPTALAYKTFDETQRTQGATQGDGSFVFPAPSKAGDQEIVGTHKNRPPVSSVSLVLDAIRKGDVGRLASAIYNNMTPAAIKIVPEIADIITNAENVPGVSRAFVSGSGSAVAILCEDENVAAKVCERAKRDGHWVAQTFTQNKGVTIV